MARPKLDPEDKKILFNCRLDDESFERLKLICYRRSVHSKKKYSEASFIAEAIQAAPVPAEPSPAQIAEYQNAFADRKVQRIAQSLISENKKLRAENVRLKAESEITS